MALEDTAILYRPLRYLFPWDQSSIHGWSLEFIFSLFASSFYFSIIYSFVSFYASVSMHCHAYLQYFKFIMTEMSKVAHEGRKQETQKLLLDALRFHVLIKQ